MRYSYHGVAKKLIREGRLTKAVFYKKQNGLENVLVLFFDSHRPMPVREYRIIEYLPLLAERGIEIEEESQ